jgi:hypothetical protein
MTTRNMYEQVTDILVQAEMAGHEDKLAVGCMGVILVALMMIAGILYVIF